MNEKTLRALRTDPAEFRRPLVIDADAGPRRLADCIDPWQAEDFAALDAGWRRVVGLPADDAKLRAYLERPRGHAKTQDLGIMATWSIFASRRQISGIAAAADKDQARLPRDAMARLISLNPWLASILEVQRDRVINKHTNSTLEVVSADAPSSFGLTPSFCVVDELTHHRNDELWVSLFSAAAKRSTCMLVIISNAGTGQGSSWQWKIREAARESEGWYFSRLDGPVASWISQKHLQEQRLLLPQVAFDRLWLNRWTTGSGDAISDDDMAAAISDELMPMRGDEPGFAFSAALDVGYRRDKTALVVMASCGATKTVRVAAVYEWAPGNSDVALQSVEDEILAAHQHFNFRSLTFDPAQAIMLSQRLRSAGLNCIEFPFTGPNLHKAASALVDLFQNRRIKTYRHEGLIRGLQSLRIEDRQFGLRLTAPRGVDGHADAAIALSIGAVRAIELCKHDTSAVLDLLPFVMGSPLGGATRLFGSRGLDGDLSPRPVPARGRDAPGFGPRGFG
jgi:hypothetical protein